MTFIEIFDFAWKAIVAAGALWAAYAYSRSQVHHENDAEARRLIEMRGERIDDLEKQIDELRSHIDNIEGQMQALQSIKAQEIAVEVARLLKGSSP